MCIYVCLVGTAEIPHSWSKFPWTSAFPVHASEPRHWGKPGSGADDWPSIFGCLSTADTVCRRATTELSHIKGDGTLAQSRRCLDQEPVIVFAYLLNFYYLKEDGTVAQSGW